MTEFKYPQDAMCSKLLYGVLNCGTCKYMDTEDKTRWCSRRNYAPVTGGACATQICQLFRLDTVDPEVDWPVDYYPADEWHKT